MPPDVDELLEAYNGEPQPALNPELQKLLGAYLQVVDNEKDSCFAQPRSSEVDELLRRYVLDQEDVSGALASSLRDHLTTDHPAVQVTPEAPPDVWTRDMAAQLREMVNLDQRVSQYASAVADHDEKLHAFKDDQESTLKGMPPPNAPPIPLGSELARTIRKKTGSGSHSPAR